MRGFGQTQGANVDTSKYPDSPPTLKMEEVIYQPFVLLSAREVDTKFGVRAILEIVLPDENGDTSKYQIWGSARIVNQVRGMSTADYPCYAMIVEVELGKGTSYELADPNTPPSTATGARAVDGNQSDTQTALPSQPDALIVEHARGQDMPESADETGPIGGVRSTPARSSGGVKRDNPDLLRQMGHNKPN